MAYRGRPAWWLGVQLLSRHDLERVAQPDRMERARVLVDTIEDLYGDEWSICGTVLDGTAYPAMLHHGAGSLSWKCACSDGDTGSWCEHVLAVGLCYLGGARGLWPPSYSS